MEKNSYFQLANQVFFNNLVFYVVFPKKNHISQFYSWCVQLYWFQPQLFLRCRFHSYWNLHCLVFCWLLVFKDSSTKFSFCLPRICGRFAKLVNMSDKWESSNKEYKDFSFDCSFILIYHCGFWMEQEYIVAFLHLALSAYSFIIVTSSSCFHFAFAITLCLFRRGLSLRL